MTFRKLAFAGLAATLLCSTIALLYAADPSEQDSAQVTIAELQLEIQKLKKVYTHRSFFS